MERSWKTTHQARRRISTITSNTGGIGSSAVSGGTSRPISEAVIKPGTAGPLNNKATTAAGSTGNRVLTGTAVGTSSSLFCSESGVDRNTSFLQDEEGLTDIIENAFEHHYRQKQHQHLETPPPTSTALSSAAAAATTTTTTTGSRLYSRAGRTPSTGSITGLMSIDDDDDTTTVSATNEYFQLERNPRRLPTTTHPKHAASGKRRRPLSSLLHILDANINRSSSSSSSSKVSRFTFLLFILVIIYLSIRNASQGMQNLGLTLPKAILGGNRAGMIRHQKRQYAEQWLERKRQVESQTKEIFTTIRNAPNVGVPIPSAYKHLDEVEPPNTSSASMLANTTTSSISTTTTTTTTTDPIPFFWHLPRSGGSTIRDLVTYCYGFTMATGQGKVPNDLSITALKVIERPISTIGSIIPQHQSKENTTIKFVNVDVYTKEGIEKAKELQLASSGLVDIVSSRLVMEAATIFTPDHPGQLFTLFRHPIHRAASTFHYVQDTVWRRKKNDLADITIEEYFKSGSGENNFLTRYLTGRINNVLTEQDLNVAKEILRRKCIVGLLEEKVESMRRFDTIFGWKTRIRKNSSTGNSHETVMDCREQLLQWGWSMHHEHDLVEEGSTVWNLILKLNEFDMQLYDYAKVLFQDQQRLFPTLEG